MIILGTDSGVERTGFSVFEKEKSIFKLLDHGLIFTDKKYSLPERLLQIQDAFIPILDQFKPDVIVFEQLFFHSNLKTAISVAQAQGVLLALAARTKKPVDFLTPPQIKLTITGYGNADKKAVHKMVQLLLQLKTMPKPDDVVDAIACGMAYCIINKD